MSPKKNTHTHTHTHTCERSACHTHSRAAAIKTFEAFVFSGSTQTGSYAEDDGITGVSFAGRDAKAQVLPSAYGCDRAFYERVINDFCIAKFKFDMEGLDRGLWCSWPDTTEIYEGLTNCTYQVALRVDCFWPNQIVDRFFMQIHRIYFHDCALTGRLIHDPPTSILAPFIAVPMSLSVLETSPYSSSISMV
uniref:Receptor activity-modifying protein 1 n=1 Tax=Dicentrarchus labrax TaxID=13489 RepID=A0A8P4GLB5_DICLA